MSAGEAAASAALFLALAFYAFAAFYAAERLFPRDTGRKR